MASKFYVQSSLHYEAEGASSLILNIRASRTDSETIICEPESILVSRDSALIMLNIPGSGPVDVRYEAVVVPVFRKIICKDVSPANIFELDPAVLPFLYPSRYCPSDQMVRFAERRFDNYPNDFEKVLAITKWIFENVEYVSGSTNSSTTSLDTITQQEGVCRDFAHLGISLCRALNIPARYCSAYAYQLEPPDFHACFEAFIAGEWIVFDATHLAPLNGLVKIAHGRDAADTAVASMFGKISNGAMTVSVSCNDNEFVPYFYADQGQSEGISLM